jgi:TolA-binding protein
MNEKHTGPERATVQPARRGQTMKEKTQQPQVKKVKSLDDEIAAAQDRLNRLLAQKREKERKDLERNQKAIYGFLRSEKLDAVPVDAWTAALPALRKLLKVEQTKGVVEAGRAQHGDPKPSDSSTGAEPRQQAA